MLAENEDLLKYIKKKYGGREVNNPCLLVNIPTGLPAIDSFYNDIDNFLKTNSSIGSLGEKELHLKRYRVYDFHKKVIKEKQ